ncbi:MAG: methyl-accepting chemotaxis protein [Rhodospirillaceae bacterium]
MNELSRTVEAGNPEQAIDLLIAGKYMSVTDSSDPLGHKIYELAQALHKRARGELVRIVDMSVNANEAVTSTAEIMRAVREVDHRTHAIAAAADEMVASVKEIARNSDDAAADAALARDAAEAAREAGDNAVSTMETITRAVEDAAGKVEGLADASQQIGDIVQQIEAIAKQTNLLALNATIEAARAGDAGKGFAVVASEVKNLAMQTARATEDIRSRIANLRSEMSSIVQSMEEGAQAVEQGREVISSTGDGMRDVLVRIESVTGKMQEVASILNQQNAASGEISEGIGTIARMASANVDSVGSILDVMDQADNLIASGIAELAAQEIKDFTVHVAKSDHMIWRKRLAEMVAGRTSLNPHELSDHHSCRLGKWYDALKDTDIINHPAYAKLADPHRDVHAAGIEAARRYNDNDLDGALNYIQKAADASVAVMKYLDELANR